MTEVKRVGTLFDYEPRPDNFLYEVGQRLRITGQYDHDKVGVVESRRKGRGRNWYRLAIPVTKRRPEVAEADLEPADGAA